MTDDNCGACIRCVDARPSEMPGLPNSSTRMILCAVCGNKRCPHATYHRYACTGSNDLGQPGSVWEHVQ